MVEALKGDDVESALRARTMTLPPSAQVKVVDDLPTPAANFYGGLHGTGCTFGFTVWRYTTSDRRVTTAGHCGNAQSYNGTALSYMGDQQIGPGHDEQSHKMSGATYKNWIRDDAAGGTRAITAKTIRLYQNVGDWVCHYGLATGYGCGNIISVASGSCGGGGSGSIGIRVDGTSYDLAEGGDSGGPWFYNGVAKGTTSCQMGYDAIYVAIDVVESGLGATLLMAP